MTLRARIIGTVLFAIIAGCTVSLRDPAGRACDDSHACAEGRVCQNGVCVHPGAQDAAPLDAAADSPGTTDTGADSSLGENLHGYGTFESGCGKWQGFQATTNATNDAHSGVGACRFCADSAGAFSLDDKGSFFGPVVGATYRARAWLRVAPGSPSPPFNGVLLRSVNQPTTALAEVEKVAGDMAVSNDWVMGEATLTLTKPAEALNVVLYSESQTCLIADDVTLERVQ